MRSKAASLAASLRRKKEPRPTYQPTADEVFPLQLVEQAKRVRRATMESFEPTWTKCILFAAGVQHLRYLQTTNAWDRQKVEEWIPQPVINYIQSKVQRIVDFFTRAAPDAQVDPNTRQETDRKAAELAEVIRQYLWERNDTEEALDEFVTWMVTTGNAFKRSYIDSRARSRVRMPRYTIGFEPLLDLEGNPVIGPDGMPQLAERYQLERGPDGQPLYEEIAQGEVNSYVLGPMQMTVPLATSRMQDAEWVMETSIQPLESLRELYPDKAGHIPHESRIVTTDLYVHRLTNLLTSGLHGVIRSIDPYSLEGYGIVHTYERAPDVDFPNGMTVVTLDDIPLYVDELPLGNEYSYEHCGYFRVPGRFWFRGAVEDLIHPQEQINKLEQFLQLNDAYNVNGVWLVPIEAGIAEGAVRNRPGQVIRYTYPYKPEREQGVSMPAQVVQRRAMYVQDVEELSGVRDVLMGDAPPNVSAGVALNRLGEEAEGMFSPITKRYERFIERDQSKGLKFVQRFYPLPRYVAVKKHGTLQEIHDFMGSDLRGNTTVKVKAGSYRPRSRSGEQQMLLEAFSLGLLPGVLTDPGQNADFLERIGVHGFDMPEGLDHKRAKWENEILVRDEGWQQIARQAGDNDLIHLQVHSNFRKTDEFLRLPLHVQQRHLMHDVQHLMAIIQAEGFHNTGDLEPDPEDLDGGGGGELGPGGEEEAGGPPQPGGERRRDQAQEGAANAS